MITILDPVAKTFTSLDTEHKTAVVRSLPDPRGPRDGHGRWDRDEAAAAPPIGSASAAGERRNGHHRDHADVTATDLGSKTIGGVLATGTRTTRTIPANTMGNSTPIVVTHEAWFSPDLKVELARLDADPFRGTEALTVSGLSREEPSPALFKVPDGFVTRTAPERAFGRAGFGGRDARPDGKLPPPHPGM